jgi:hypothetical protein
MDPWIAQSLCCDFCCENTFQQNIRKSLKVDSNDIIPEQGRGRESDHPPRTNQTGDCAETWVGNRCKDPNGTNTPPPLYRGDSSTFQHGTHGGEELEGGGVKLDCPTPHSYAPALLPHS